MQELLSVLVGRFVIVLSVQQVLAMFNAIWRRHGETRKTPSAQCVAAWIQCFLIVTSYSTNLFPLAWAVFHQSQPRSLWNEQRNEKRNEGECGRNWVGESQWSLIETSATAEDPAKQGDRKGWGDLFQISTLVSATSCWREFLGQSPPKKQSEPFFSWLRPPWQDEKWYLEHVRELLHHINKYMPFCLLA